MSAELLQPERSAPLISITIMICPTITAAHRYSSTVTMWEKHSNMAEILLLY